MSRERLERLHDAAEPLSIAERDAMYQYLAGALSYRVDDEAWDSALATAVDCVDRARRARRERAS